MASAVMLLTRGKVKQPFSGFILRIEREMLYISMYKYLLCTPRANLSGERVVISLSR